MLKEATRKDNGVPVPYHDIEIRQWPRSLTSTGPSLLCECVLISADFGLTVSPMT